jgi:hypothetical protein
MVLPRTRWPFLSERYLYEVFTPSTLAPCFHGASSHGLLTQLKGSELPAAVCALQSFKEPMEWLVSYETADLHEVLVLIGHRSDRVGPPRR